MTCPLGWNASEFGCHRVVKAAVPQYDCPALCGPNATIACIGSAAENAYVERLAAQHPDSFMWLWLGHYRPSNSWECVAGGAAPFENWDNITASAVGPDQSSGYEYSYRCAAMSLTLQGRWLPRSCAPQVSMAHPFSCGGCACEYGGGSAAAYVSFSDSARQSYGSCRRCARGRRLRLRRRSGSGRRWKN